MRARIDRLFVLAFAALLAAPLVQMWLRIVPVPAVEERREFRALVDPLPRLAAMDPKLAGDVNGWFDDHYGFRDLLIRINNEINYQFFRTADKVFIGKDGWLFAKEDFNQIVKDAGDAAAAGAIVTSLRNLRDCLARRNVGLVVVLNTSKSSLYPEFLPPEAARNPPSRLAQRVAAVLDEETGLIFIDAERVLRKHRDETVFFKTDMHMNPKGAWFVYGELIKRLSSALDELPPPAKPQSWREHYWPYGGEARYLSKFLPLGEMVAMSSASFGAMKDDEFGKFRFDLGKGAVPGRPDIPLFDWTFENKRDQANLLPPIMLFGTSFTDPLFDLRLNEDFKAIYRTKSNIPERIVRVLQNLPPDVKFLVLEYPEPFVGLIEYLPVGRNCEMPNW
ncbi:MAG: hypothetical protein JOZ40_11610 [Methylobacteriaceae bacterium]|nr:hypothetical protein [Methylobacteriaceae bacterium]